MQKSELRELRGLVERISRGDCVLVLGPHVAVRKTDRRPFDELLAEELGAADPKNLRRAAEAYLAKRRQDRDEVASIMRDVYEDAETTELHRDLAQLPFRICINASWDHLMAAAFEQAGKAPVTAYYSYKPSPPRRLTAPTAERPLVYHLFGHHEEPLSLVLTEGDLIDYLVAFVKENPPLSDHVRSILDDPAASFLFIGFGFHQWYVRVLLHGMRVYKHNRPTMALEDLPFFAHPEHEQAVGFFSERLIDIRPLKWEEFARNLRAAYDEYAQKAAPKPVASRASTPSAVAGGKGPRAFVSYASEDRDAVEQLAQELEARGIDVWQDKQDLRSGDRWEDVLLDVIGQKVDYVIVVQTAAMARRIEGVYHQEIDAALKRQRRMGFSGDQQLRFLHPVRLGDCPLHPRLKELHVIDAADIDGLAQSILEDWTSRQGVPA
ncbi:MAG TPA: toll/interleukin-1 receptor domain-containing protein [Thermoanaerobaculia bacterium]